MRYPGKKWCASLVCLGQKIVTELNLHRLGNLFYLLHDNNRIHHQQRWQQKQRLKPVIVRQQMIHTKRTSITRARATTKQLFICFHKIGWGNIRNHLWTLFFYFGQERKNERASGIFECYAWHTNICAHRERGGREWVSKRKRVNVYSIPSEWMNYTSNHALHSRRLGRMRQEKKETEAEKTTRNFSTFITFELSLTQLFFNSLALAISLFLFLYFP